MTNEISHMPNVGELLAGVSRFIRAARVCWLVTDTHASGPAIRPMSQLPHSDESLCVNFVADRRSRKAEEIWNHGNVQLLYSHDGAPSYVVLSGEALVHTSAEEVNSRWSRGFDAYFPTPEDRAHAAFIEVQPRTLKLWIRGLSPEPFGLRPALLSRDGHLGWKCVDAL
jgi:general stress protein 26